MTVAQFMTACLHDPDVGYYATRPALGEAGDFITAPLVTPDVRRADRPLGGRRPGARLGRPARVRAGRDRPGRRDADERHPARRRAGAPGFLGRRLWLVETSAPLRALQASRLGDRPRRWAARLDEVPAGAPLILIANELLDCLPARQFVRTADRLGRADGGPGRRRRARLRPAATPAASLLPDAAPRRRSSSSLAGPGGPRRRARRAASSADGGAALLIDYGRADARLRRHPAGAAGATRRSIPLADAGRGRPHRPRRLPRGDGRRARRRARHGDPHPGASFLARLGIGSAAEALVRAAPDRAATHRPPAGPADRPPTRWASCSRPALIHSPGLAAAGFRGGA